MAHSQTPVAAALQTGEPVHREDVVIERPDRSRVTVCVHIDAIRDEGGKIIGVVNFFYDVAERRTREADIQAQAQRLELAVEERTASLRALSSRLMSAQDEERRRVSRELHDGVAQLLGLAKMGLSALVRATQDQPALLDLAQEARTRVDLAIAQTRTISFLFHPPLLDELGFRSAVHAYAEGLSKRIGLEIEVRIPPNLPRSSQQIETALFRIVQESLTNVHRHSGASKAIISLAANDSGVQLEISDNGKGFDLPGAGAFGVGLTGIRERLRELQGTLEIQSRQGVRIIANVPVALQTKAAQAQ